MQVDWKLLRGKWRPKLLDYAKSADSDAVTAATKSAFAVLGSYQEQEPTLQNAEQALKELIKLKVLLHLLPDCLCLPAQPACTNHADTCNNKLWFTKYTCSYGVSPHASGCMLMSDNPCHVQCNNP